jgi:fucose permease
VLLAAASPRAALAVAALIASGAALAGIFPTVLGILGARFPDSSGTVFGLTMAMALCGGITLPWAAAHIAAGPGLRWVLAMVAAAFCAIAALSAALRDPSPSPGA